MCDELTVGYGDNKLYNKTEKNAANMGFDRWGNCYKQIRQANIDVYKRQIQGYLCGNSSYSTILFLA